MSGLVVRHRTLLPHVLTLLYGLAIAFASLQPFSPWIPPAAGTPFWLAAPWPPRFTRFDIVANLVAYVPFVVIALAMSLGTVLGPASAPAKRRRDGAIAVGVFLIAVVVVAWWFYPVWTGVTLPIDEWRMRMWMPTWT